MRLLCLLLVLSSLSSDVIAASSGSHSLSSSKGVEVETGVIFSSDISVRAGICDSFSSCWTPEKRDILMLEKSLSDFLRASKDPRAQNIFKSLVAYKRKYFGYLRNETRNILVVGLCAKFWHPGSATFQTDQRPMTDMGECYFSVEYDTKTGRFSELYVDGEA